MFRLYWIASHGATKRYLAWREQQQPKAAQAVHSSSSATSEIGVHIAPMNGKKPISR